MKFVFVCSWLLLAAANAQSAVPFVGCASDGQVGPTAAPKGVAPKLSLPSAVAEKLAYYESPQGLAVLAPRGWHCFGTVGSSGSALYVTPTPINWNSIQDGGFRGPAIELDQFLGDTSGRFSVARVIARIFPAYSEFARNVQSDTPNSPFPSGPFPGDLLTRKSKTVVEYKTPPQTEGLGTQSRLQKNADPIEGVAILIDPDPDLLLLSIRLPRGLADLSHSIIQFVEQNSANMR